MRVQFVSTSGLVLIHKEDLTHLCYRFRWPDDPVKITLVRSLLPIQVDFPSKLKPEDVEGSIQDGHLSAKFSAKLDFDGSCGPK